VTHERKRGNAVAEEVDANVWSPLKGLTPEQREMVLKAKDRLGELVEEALANSSWASQPVTTGPGACDVQTLTAAARKVQAGYSLHASNTVVKVVNRFDAFGTDYTAVDRMANPYRIGTEDHRDWMMAWVDAQYHWRTKRYQDHHAEVSDARDAMIESCAPVANWVDEVMFEVAEAREECENVEDFEGYEPVGAFIDEGWHLGQIFDDDFKFEIEPPGPNEESIAWKIGMTYRVPPALGTITINVV
jgi:hypothetical protein